jgi:mannose-6-phosphate isomerase
VAETWEISDYRHTSGTVVNGAFAGRTLHDLVTAYPAELVGEGWHGPHFPLLDKFLDASHMLPVHLHADDETAARVYHEPNGKTEAWHILWAAPGASILAGVKPNFGHDELFAAFKAQEYDAVMYRYPIEAGDTVYVPGGCLHAFGPDTLIFEVQQTSDLAQNVMPTDIFGNRLDEATWDANINGTLAELRTTYLPRPTAGLARPSSGPNRYVIGCAGPHFALERWSLTAPHTEPAHPQRCLTLSCVEGAVDIAYQGGTARLERAASCILPAALGSYTVIPDAQAGLVACYVPDLARDIVGPLREAGYADDDIRALGEVGV